MQPDETEALSQLIARLYDAALNPADWSGMAGHIAQWFGVESCGLNLLGPGRHLLERLSQTANYSPEMTIAHREHYFNIDPWIKFALASPTGTLINSGKHFSDEEFQNSEYHNDFLKRCGNNFYCLGHSVVVSANENISSTIGLHRPKRQEAFADADERKFKLLIPHFQRALQMRQHFLKLSFSQTVHAEALAALATGVLVTDKFGKLLFSNTQAEQVLTTGSQLAIQNGYLQIPLRSLTEQLLTMISKVANIELLTKPEQAGGWLSIPRPNRNPLQLLICPLPRALTASTEGAIIFLHNSEKANVASSTQLQQLYGFTPAEARLAQALLQGQSLADYAQHTDISLHTAKNHLRRIFEKTGHASQIDFIRAALSNPLLSMNSAKL